MVKSKASWNARAEAWLILSMAGSADLFEAGLGDFTEECHDWKTAWAAAYALQHVGQAHVYPSSTNYIVLEQIIKCLCVVALHEEIGVSTRIPMIL
jgi:hypothetical protein